MWDTATPAPILTNSANLKENKEVQRSCQQRKFSFLLEDVPTSESIASSSCGHLGYQGSSFPHSSPVPWFFFFHAPDPPLETELNHEALAGLELNAQTSKAQKDEPGREIDDCALCSRIGQEAWTSASLHRVSFGCNLCQLRGSACSYPVHCTDDA